jgi:spermidine synthase
MCGGALVMSDTPAEVDDHWAPIHYAQGAILLNGLGLGVVLGAILCKPEVKTVTVVEIAPEVIELIGPSYTDARVELICADALTWQPPRNTRYQVVWHDIWIDICADNLSAMHHLHRRYGRRTEWQGSWSEEMVR